MKRFFLIMMASLPLASAWAGTAATEKEDLRVCEDLVKSWVNQYNSAKAALEACRLHQFNQECAKTAEARAKIVAPKSVCARFPKVVEKKWVELNCTIVRVPDHCGGE